MGWTLATLWKENSKDISQKTFQNFKKELSYRTHARKPPFLIKLQG